MTAGLPKTELVYLKDTQRTQDQANAIRVVLEKRTHAYLVLDRTIFHPKGGGQPTDHGTMTSSGFVVSVKKAIFHRGVVVHWVKIINGTPATGPVTCELDWPYRYLTMRRHTAAHLIDHCLAEATSARVQTTDSWLDEPCYVGYNGNPPDNQTLKQVQDLANSMISAGALVRIEYLTPEQGRSLLQTAPNFERLPDLDEIRIVTIADCAPIPCGGTHVSNTNMIRELTVIRWRNECPGKATDFISQSKNDSIKSFSCLTQTPKSLQHIPWRTFNHQPLSCNPDVQLQRTLQERKVRIRCQFRGQVNVRRLVDPSIVHPLFRYHETRHTFFQQSSLRVQIQSVFVTENCFTGSNHQCVNFDVRKHAVKAAG